MLADDVNGDGFPDVIMVGNDYGNEVFSGRYDAFNGLVLLGDGKGDFKPAGSGETGFYVPGDAKALVNVLTPDGGDLWLASQNRDSLKVFESVRVPNDEVIELQADEIYGEISFTDGRKQRVEFYYGSGAMSQSSRMFRMPAGCMELVLFRAKGESRKLKPVVVASGKAPI